MSPKIGYGRRDDKCPALRNGDGAPCTLGWPHEGAHSYAGEPFELEQAKCLDVCPGAHDPCQLPKGHKCKHCNGLIEWLDPCMVCRSREGVRRFAVTVDGEELRMFALLCAAHGDQHLLNVGRVLGELFARKGSSRS
jgi:hypothetical protein